MPVSGPPSRGRYARPDVWTSHSTSTASSPPDNRYLPSVLNERHPTACACQCTLAAGGSSCSTKPSSSWSSPEFRSSFPLAAASLDNDAMASNARFRSCQISILPVTSPAATLEPSGLTATQVMAFV